jgi:small basic protein
MIVVPFLAVALGFFLFWGPMRGVETNEAFARYLAIAVLAGLDTVLGGLRAWLEEAFDDAVFISGFFANALLAAALVALGEKFGLETGGDGRISVMMIGAVVIFSSRIFNNLAALRRLLIERWRQRASRPTSEAPV